MRSLAYLTGHMAKNRILQVRRKPGLLVLYLFFIALMVFSFFSASGGLGHAAAAELLDIGWLKLIFVGYIGLFAFTSVYNGLSTGGSVFEMADANFLFTSPVNPKQILVYGLARQAVRSLFASIFILFMGSTLYNFWGIGPAGLLVIFVGYVLALVIFQLVSVVIYMYANGRPNIKRVVAAVAVALLVPLVLSVLVPTLGGTPVSEALMAAMEGNILFTVPVAGWVSLAVFGLLYGSPLTAALAGGLCAALVLACLGLLTVGRPDYYEDVLVATETAFQRQRAAAEGDLQAANTTRRRVKVDGRDTLRGHGAAVFLGKHLLEDFRKNRLKLLDAGSFSTIVTAVIMAFFMRGEMGGQMLSILITTMFMRAMLVGTGLGLRELYMHYIFMVPASSFAKIVWGNLEVCVKSLVENVIAFAAAGAIMGASLPDIIMCIVCSSVFAVVLVAVNLLSMRLFANVISQGLLITFYLLFVMLVMAPGVVGAVLAGFGLGWVLGGGAFAVGLAALTLWEVLLAAVLLFLSRGVLHTCDMETMPGKKG